MNATHFHQVSRLICKNTIPPGVLTLFGVILLILSGSVFSRNNSQTADQVQFLIDRAMSDLGNGEYESARQLMNKASLHGLSIDSLYYLIAETYIDEGNIEEALKHNAIIKAPPKSPMHRMQLEQRVALYTISNDSVAAEAVYDSLIYSFPNIKRKSLFPVLSIISNVGFDFLRERQSQHFLLEQNPSYEIDNIGPYAFGDLSLKMSWKTESIMKSHLLFGLRGKIGKSSSRNPSLNTGHFLDNIRMSIQPFVQWNDLAEIWSISSNYSLLVPKPGTILNSLQINNSINLLAGSWYCMIDLGISSKIKPFLHGSIDLYTLFDQTYLNEHGFMLSLYGGYINEETIDLGFSESQSILYNDGWPEDCSIFIESDTALCEFDSESDYCTSITNTLFYNVHPQQFLSIAPNIGYRLSPRPWFSVEMTIGYKYDFYLQLSRWRYLNLPSNEVSDATYYVYYDEIKEPIIHVTYDESSGKYYITNLKTGTETSILNEMQKRRIDNILSTELLLEFYSKNSGRFELTLGCEKTYSNLERYLPLEITDFKAYAYVSWYFTFKH